MRDLDLLTEPAVMAGADASAREILRACPNADRETARAIVEACRAMLCDFGLPTTRDWWVRWGAEQQARAEWAAVPADVRVTLDRGDYMAAALRSAVEEWGRLRDDPAGLAERVRLAISASAE